MELHCKKTFGNDSKRKHVVFSAALQIMLLSVSAPGRKVFKVKSHQVHKGTSGDFMNELSISASETLYQASPQVKGDSISENL